MHVRKTISGNCPKFQGLPKDVKKNLPRRKETPINNRFTYFCPFPSTQQLFSDSAEYLQTTVRLSARMKLLVLNNLKLNFQPCRVYIFAFLFDFSFGNKSAVYFSYSSNRNSMRFASEINGCGRYARSTALSNSL